MNLQITLMLLLLACAPVRGAFETLRLPQEETLRFHDRCLQLNVSQWYGVPEFRDARLRLAVRQKQVYWQIGWTRFGWDRYREHRFFLSAGPAGNDQRWLLELNWNRLELGDLAPRQGWNVSISGHRRLQNNRQLHLYARNLLPESMSAPAEWQGVLLQTLDDDWQVQLGYRMTAISAGDWIFSVSRDLQQWRLSMGLPGYRSQWFGTIEFGWGDFRWNISTIWHGELGLSWQLSCYWYRAEVT